MDDVLGHEGAALIVTGAASGMGAATAQDGGFQGARHTGRHQAGWADLIDGG